MDSDSVRLHKPHIDFSEREYVIEKLVRTAFAECSAAPANSCCNP